MEGITYIDKFIENPGELYLYLLCKVEWDERMQARKTASFGKAYNYSQMEYPQREFPTALKELIEKIDKELDIEPNNCLINYYINGKSKMGFHSDRTDILEKNTGVMILSVGEPRILRFRKIDNPLFVKELLLESGSLFYMTNEFQKVWQHAIPKSETSHGRMSLTFRKLSQKKI